MTLRHKRVVATLDIGTAADWNNDHHFDPSSEVSFHTTFTEHDFATMWDDSQCTGAGTAVLSDSNGHVFLMLDTDPANGDIATCMFAISGTGADITSDEWEPSATFRIFNASVVRTGRFWEFGFFRAADTPFTANDRKVCFYMDGVTLYAKTGDGAAETTTNLGTYDDSATYRVELTETNAKFYVDNLVTPLATHTTNLPTTNLTIKLSAKAGALGEALLYCDFFGLKQKSVDLTV